MTRRSRLILCAAAAAAATGLLAAGIVYLTGGKAAGLPAVGRVIPAAQRPPGPGISGTTLTGQRLNITSWRGHTVVINFWGSWCVPCRKEAPVLARVAGDTRP
jgi:thiol-disulfide isomerase/thioredoxin